MIDSLGLEFLDHAADSAELPFDSLHFMFESVMFDTVTALITACRHTSDDILCIGNASRVDMAVHCVIYAPFGPLIGLIVEVSEMEKMSVCGAVNRVVYLFEVFGNSVPAPMVLGSYFYTEFVASGGVFFIVAHYVFESVFGHGVSVFAAEVDSYGFRTDYFRGSDIFKDLLFVRFSFLGVVHPDVRTVNAEICDRKISFVKACSYLFEIILFESREIEIVNIRIIYIIAELEKIKVAESIESAGTLKSVERIRGY